MKKITRLIALLLVTLSFPLIESCSDDPIPDGPSVTGPSSIPVVQVGGTADVTFSVVIPGGFKSVTASATKGTAAVTSEPAAGAVAGDVVVTFTAGAVAGAGQVKIEVVDNNNKVQTEAATIEVHF